MEEIKVIKYICNMKFLDRNKYVILSEVSYRYKKVFLEEVEKVIRNLLCEKVFGFDVI